jgi:hypothetical protein
MKKNNRGKIEEKRAIIKEEHECCDCSDDSYFYLEDGEGYCQFHAMKHLKEIIQAKATDWKCYYCNEMLTMDDKLFHLSTEHMKEIENDRKRK